MGTRQGTGKKYGQRMYIAPERLGWDLGKNSKLKEERGVSFEEVRERVRDMAYDIVTSPSRNHPGQPCLRLTLSGKRWLVPFHRRADHVYLFTIMEVGK